VYVRAAPCVCDHCFDKNWDMCAVGGWEHKKMSLKKMRNLNAKHIEQQLSAKSFVLLQEQFEILSIQQQRVKKRKAQYLVEWKGYKTMSCVDEDDNNTPELLKDWEIQNLSDVQDSYIAKKQNISFIKP